MNKKHDFEHDVIPKTIFLFTTYGYAGTELSLISNETGVPKSSILSPFGSKKELLKECADNYLDRYTSIMEIDVVKKLKIFYSSAQNLGAKGCFLHNMATEEKAVLIIKGQIKCLSEEFIRDIGRCVKKPFRATTLYLELVGSLLMWQMNGENSEFLRFLKRIRSVSNGHN